MTEETAIVPQETVYLGVLELSPETVISRASTIASALAEIIEDRKLYVNIGSGQHVVVEGWNTLGTMVGISPKEREVIKTIDDFGIVEYEAYVDLIRNTDGLIIGGASSICRTDENNWSNKPFYAVRSMAVTRATGKAFRLKLSWIMELAGFSPTPAEEMMDVVNGKARDVGPRMKNQWEQSILAKVMDLQLVKAKRYAVNILNQSPFTEIPFGELDMTEAIGYIVLRLQLKEILPDAESEERQRVANEAWEQGDNEEAIAKALELLGETT